MREFLRDDSVENNFEKLFGVEKALHHDARLPSFQDLMPPLYEGKCLGEFFAWSLTRTDAMKLGRSGELGSPDNAKKRTEQRTTQRNDTECDGHTKRRNSRADIVVVVRI